MTYNPMFYAQDLDEWAEWVAAEYEAEKAHDDVEIMLTYWQTTHDDFAFALQQRYARRATELAERIEDATEVRMLEAEQAAY